MASQVFGGAIEDSAEFVVFRDNETTQVIGDNPSVPGTLLEVMSLPAGVLQSDGTVTVTTSGNTWASVANKRFEEWYYGVTPTFMTYPTHTNCFYLNWGAGIAAGGVAGGAGTLLPAPPAGTAIATALWGAAAGVGIQVGLNLSQPNCW